HADTALRRRCPGDEVIVDSPRILEVIAGRQTSLCVIDLRQAPPTVELTGNFVGVGIAEVRIVGGTVIGDVVAGSCALPVVVEGEHSQTFAGLRHPRPLVESGGLADRHVLVGGGLGGVHAEVVVDLGGGTRCPLSAD